MISGGHPALHPAKNHTNRESSYRDYMSVLNLKVVEFPMTQIKKFENLNDISINVYCIKKQKELSIFPIRLTAKREKHVNLLYVQDPRDDNVGHFVWIKDLSRLVSSQLSKYGHKKFFCDRYMFNKNYKIFYNFLRK